MSKTIYDVASGRILARSISGHGGPQIGDDVAQVDGSYDPVTQYLPGGVPTDRAVINYSIDKPVIQKGGEIATVSGLPDPSDVLFGMTSYATTGGSFTFSADTVGDYLFVVNEPAFMKISFAITAVE